MGGGKSKSKSKFTHIKPYTTHLSSKSEKEIKSVQQRLEDSRRSASRPKTTSEAIQRIKGLNSLATTASRPLETRTWLQVPESAPIQQRRRRHGQRQSGPAGPAPPRSWGLAGSRFAPARMVAAMRFDRAERIELEFDAAISRIAKVELGERMGSHSLPRKGSLKYLALKTLARNWDWLVRDEMLWLEDFEYLETGMKSVLISYLGAFGIEVGKEDLDVLFRESDSKDLKRLDFSGTVGRSLSLKHISRFLANPKKRRRSSESGEAGDRQEMRRDGGSGSKKAYDSWEDEANLIEAQLISRTIGGSAFIHLTHLSLTKPGPNVSWSDLLELAPKLNLLTHLSLAYWKTPEFRGDRQSTSPSTDDNSRTTWDEPAHVLRSLSKLTYSLEWLDLEGCNLWLPALAVGYHNPPLHVNSSSSPHSSSDEDDVFWHDGLAMQAKGPDWNGSWRKLKYINITPHYLPDSITAVRRAMPCQIRNEILYHLQDQRRKQGLEENGEDENPGPAGWTWKDAEYQLWEVQTVRDREIVAKVRTLLDRHVVFDYGWEAARLKEIPLRGDLVPYPRRV